MKKPLLLVIVLLLTNFRCSKKPIDACPNCFDPAFKITLVDSSGHKLSGFTIRAINNQNDTTVVSDTTNNGGFFNGIYYEIQVKKGVYNIEIKNPNYTTIALSAIAVTEGKCGINPRTLTIEPESNTLSKLKAVSDSLHCTILVDSVGKGCGN